MIVFNKSNYKEHSPTVKKVITKESVTRSRRVNPQKRQKISQSNKEFLKALGFKV